MFQCSHCSYTTNDADQLDKHAFLVHPEEYDHMMDTRLRRGKVNDERGFRIAPRTHSRSGKRQ